MLSFFSDALSVLEAIQNPKKEDLDQLTMSLRALSEHYKKVVLQWIPAHCNIKGNEKADHLAKCGSKKEQSDLSLTYKEASATIKAATKTRWKEQHPEYDANTHYHQLTRKEQVIIFRLRTGHCRLQHHLHHKGHGALRSNSWFVIPGKTIGPIFLKLAWIIIGPKTLSLVTKSLGSSFVLM